MPLRVVASWALLAIDLISDGVGARFLAGVLAFFVGILGVYTVVYLFLAPRVLPRLNPWVSTILFYGPVLVLPYVDALPGTFRVALSIYVTVSIVVVVFVRYGGCEVVGIPSLIIGRATSSTARGTQWIWSTRQLRTHHGRTASTAEESEWPE